MSDLGSYLLHLRPVHHAKIPAWLGRAAHAWFLSQIQRIDPALSQALHDTQGYKPFTVSTLLPLTEDELHILKPGNRYQLRITTLRADLTRMVQSTLMALWLTEGIVLHDQHFRVEQIDQQSTSFAALNNQPANTDGRLSLRFETPTLFKRTGGDLIPLPLPEYVFGSLWDRWASVAPAPLPESLKTWMAETLTIRYCRIRTRSVSFERANRGTLIGFIGDVTYQADNDPQMRRLWHLLGQFASYSAIGAKTGFGLGMAQSVYEKHITGETSL